MLSLVILGSTLDAQDYLTTVSENENQVIIAVIFWLILAVSVIGIGIMIFPILKKHIESLALGYVGIRLIEAVFIIIASLSLLTLLTLGKEYVEGSLDASYYQPLGTLLRALFDWSFVIGTMIFLGLGGLPLNYILFQSKLVPRFISVWGLIGAALVLIYGLLSLSESIAESTGLNLLAFPIAVQEMVFAAWLIVKGFNPSAIASEPVKTDVN